MDWRTWHEDYDLPGSSLAKRLKVIQTGPLSRLMTVLLGR
jgi:hypothetical protein